MIKEDLKALKIIKERYDDPKVSKLVSPLISLLKELDNPEPKKKTKAKSKDLTK